jgi:hypothetical protein
MSVRDFEKCSETGLTPKLAPPLESVLKLGTL